MKRALTIIGTTLGLMLSSTLAFAQDGGLFENPNIFHGGNTCRNYLGQDVAAFRQLGPRLYRPSATDGGTLVAGCPFFIDYTSFHAAPDAGPSAQLCVQVDVTRGNSGTITCQAATYDNDGGPLNGSGNFTHSSTGQQILKTNITLTNIVDIRLVFLYCELPEDSYINNYRYWIAPSGQSCP